MENKLNILIIGGSSFVAKSFIAYHKLNYNIKIVSRGNTENKNEFIIGDFFQIPDELFQGIDVVINCAAIVHQAKKIPETTYNKINFELAVNLAEKSKKNRVTTFIQISTIAVYGNAEYINLNTSENPGTHYGKSKLLADNKILTLADESFKIIIFRPPMIYGSDNAPGNMMRLIHLVNKGFPLPFKNAINKRDFINIRNFVGYLEAAIQINETNIYLINDNIPISTHELINLISKHLNKTIVQFSLPKIIVKILQKMKPEILTKLYGTLIIDCKKSNEILRYTPHYSLDQGIQEMIFGSTQKQY